MREIELKITLDADQERRLRNGAVTKSFAVGPARTQMLHSRYFDTADDMLRLNGYALRVRKAGQSWVQTLKKADAPIDGGLSRPLEDECPLQGPDLQLGLIADDDLREDVIGIARAGLHVVAETRFRRTARQMRSPTGGLVELAIDKGDLIASDVKSPFIEAELELIEGHAGDLYALAAELFPKGPVRYSGQSKSQRALAFAGKAPGETIPRKAQRVVLPSDEMVEGAAMRIMSEGVSHYLPNLALLLETDHPGGPHQIRVALRRLRSALSAFRPALGRQALAPWADQARMIASEAGRLRDLDVLGADLIARLAKANPDEAGFHVLADAVAARRSQVQAEVRTALAGPDVTRFGFAIAGFIATRGWLDPADHTQTARLAAPVRPFAEKVLRRRWKAVAGYGKRIENLSIDQRHEMRKELKKLRYLMDAFSSLFDGDAAPKFISQLKVLQKGFGALNDSAMAEMILTAPDAPGAGDPVAARGAGRVIGHLLAQADHKWPDAVAAWHTLVRIKPFWQN